MLLSWARNNQIAAFLLIAFGIPWIGWTARALLFADQPLDRSDWSFGSWFLFYFGAGPLIGAFVMRYVSDGMDGVRDLARACVRWRAPVFWQLFAVFLFFVTETLAFFLGAAVAGVDLGGFEPLRIWRMATPAMLALVLVAPIVEEPGWRGYLLPKLMETQSALSATLVLGAIWTMWHFPLSFMPNYFDFFQDPLQFWVYGLSATCVSVFMSCVYLNGGGSVFLAVVLHWSVIAAPKVVGGMFPNATEEAMAAVLVPKYVAMLAIYVVFAVALAIVLGPTLRGRAKPSTTAATPQADAG